MFSNWSLAPRGSDPNQGGSGLQSRTGCSTAPPAPNNPDPVPRVRHAAGANGVLLVYDVTNRKTFDELGIWVDIINKNCHPSSNKILVGNKVTWRQGTHVATR